jgi:hypothetical protein
MAQEVWRDVVGFEGLYIVSDHGNVMSLPRITGRNGAQRNRNGRMLTKTMTPNGYLKVTLYKAGKTYQINIHRLVMRAFVGPSELQVNHKDEDKTNNCLDNLEYMTGLENTRYSCCKPVECYDLETGEIIKRYGATCDAEVDGHDQGGVSSACLGKPGFEHYHGFGWRFAQQS